MQHRMNAIPCSYYLEAIDSYSCTTAYCGRDVKAATWGWQLVRWKGGGGEVRFRR